MATVTSPSPASRTKALRLESRALSELNRCATIANAPFAKRSVVLVSKVAYYFMVVRCLPGQPSVAFCSGLLFSVSVRPHTFRRHTSTLAAVAECSRPAQWLVPRASLVHLRQHNRQLEPPLGLIHLLLGLVCAFFAHAPFSVALCQQR